MDQKKTRDHEASDDEPAFFSHALSPFLRIVSLL
jgi:hypothetical protein